MTQPVTLVIFHSLERDTTNGGVAQLVEQAAHIRWVRGSSPFAAIFINKRYYPLMSKILKDKQFYKFCAYGFLKNLRFFDPFIILFFREMGLSFFEIGVLFSIREISTNVFEIPTGIVADSYGRRKSMIFSFSAYIISFIVFYFFPYFSIYAVAMIFFAVGDAFRTGTHKAMILEYLKLKGIEDTKVEYYGRTRGCSKLGSAVSSIIAALLIFYSGSFKIVFLASIVPYVAELFLMISYPKYLDGDLQHQQGKNVLHTILLQIKSTLIDFISIFKNKTSLVAILNSASFDSIFKTIKDYLQPILKIYSLSIPLFLYLSENQRTSILNGLVYFFLFLLTSFASVSSGKVTKRFKNLSTAVNITYLAGGIIILASGISLRASLFVVAIILFVLLYMLQNIRRPMNVGLISELISNKIMATGLSGESQIKTLLVALLSPIMGFLADRFGLANALIAFGFLTFIFLLVFRVKPIATKSANTKA